MSATPSHPEYCFRTWESGDGRHLFELNADPRVLRWTGDLPFLDVHEAEAFVGRYTHFSDFGFGRWLVTRKEDGALLGWAGLRQANGQIDLGFRWHHRYWNQGHARRTGKAILSWARHQNILEIFAQHHPENQASSALLMGLGFRPASAWQGADAGWRTYVWSPDPAPGK
jgi:ribosomal-protein-alanine N-acetyltransferase